MKEIQMLKRLKKLMVFFQGLMYHQKTALATCNEQLGFEEGILVEILEYVRRIVRDDNFIQQTLAINEEIFNLGQDEE